MSKTRFLFIVGLVFLGQTIASRSIAELNSSSPEFFCEQQMREATPQALIEFGLTRGFLSAPQDLILLMDLIQNGSFEGFVQKGQGPEAQLYRQVLVRSLEPSPNQNQVVGWMRQRLTAWDEEFDVRDQVRAEVEDISLKRPKMEFVTIQGGKYWIPVKLMVGEVNIGETPETSVVPVEIPYDFEVLSTPVTQAMWASVMGAMPEHLDLEADSPYFSEGDTEFVALNGNLIDIARDFPVTNVSFASAAEFANRLSRAQGYKEAYSGLSLDGDPQVGTALLKRARMKPRLRNIEGYRLMSEAEWAILLLESHEWLNQNSLEKQRQKLQEWAWLYTNAQLVLHPVARRQPFVFPSGAVYDLLGLVEEMIHPVFSDREEVNQGYDAIDGELSNRSKIVTLGGDILSQPHREVYNNRSEHHRVDRSRLQSLLNEAHRLTGFRLVRTLKRKNPK